MGHTSTLSMAVSSDMFPTQVLVTIIYLKQFLITAAFTVFCCTSGSDTMFTWLEGVVTGILAGPCGYSGNFNSLSNAAIFWANQDLLCTMYSAEFSMNTCFTQNLVKTSPCFLFYSAEFSRNVCFTPNLVKTSKCAKFSRILYFTRNLVKTSTW